MAGYTGEKRWRNQMNPYAPDGGISELARDACGQMLHALTNSEALYIEMLELYTYAGGTIQDLANQLFTEDIAARQIVGTNAIVTMTVVGGVIDSVSIDNAGTGYVNGNYRLNGVQGGNNNATIDYTVTNRSVTSVSIVSGGSSYPDGSSQPILNFPLAGFASDTVANADEVAKTQAAFDAITALHELYQAADNVAVPQEDRLAQLRRMT